MKKISVIMPVYNGEKYLKDSIESVIEQTYNEWELIIVDDGSTDSSYDICKNYAEKDKRIKLIHQENKGVSSARETGIKTATGEYLSFIDCDDMYTKDRLEKVIKIFEEDEECELVYCGYNENLKELEEEVIVKKQTRNETIDDFVFIQKLSTLWRCTMKTKLVKKVKNNHMKYCEDLFFILEYISMINYSIQTSEKLYNYRVNENSVTMNLYKEKYLRDFQNIPVRMYHYFLENNLVSNKYREKICCEYAYSALRIKKTTNYRDFVKIVNQAEFREGLKFCKFYQNDLKKSFVYLLIKYKIYFPFLLIK